MRFQKMLRMQMILAGLAVAFFAGTGTARAQEITNTEFNNMPNTVPFVQPAPVQSSGAATVAITSSEAMRAAGSIAASIPAQQTVVVQSKSAKMWVASTLLLCVGLFIASARTAKNENRNPRYSILTRSMPLA